MGVAVASVAEGWAEGKEITVPSFGKALGLSERRTMAIIKVRVSDAIRVMKELGISDSMIVIAVEIMDELDLGDGRI